MSNTPSRSGGIDPAALAAATLAAAIAAIAPPGPYSPLGSAIGISVLAIICVYDVDPHRTGFQSVAFSGVFGLIFLLAVGYGLELLMASDRTLVLGALRQDPDANTPSNVPTWLAIIVWLGSATIMCILDRKVRIQHR